MPAAVYIWQRVVRTKLTLRPTIEVHIRLESRLELSDEKMTKPRLTADIKIPRTPLMESIFTYV